MINEILTGDARQLSKAIPDETCDLVFADPVYWNIEDYEWLGDFATRVLKPNGALLAWCAKTTQSQIAIEKSGLTWQWTLNYTVQAKPNVLHLYGVYMWTTPCLFFAKGIKKFSPYRPDTYIDNSPAQNNFEWQKNLGVIRHWLTGLTKKGDLVIDPFCGSGSVPVACKTTGRNYIAFEIDEQRAAAARERVATAPMPLFVLEPEQSKFEMESA